jgi:hypothetical protein
LANLTFNKEGKPAISGKRTTSYVQVYRGLISISGSFGMASGSLQTGL